jgi:hypothetical protein
VWTKEPLPSTREAEPAGKTTDPATAKPTVWEDGVDGGGFGEDRRRSALEKLCTARLGPTKERGGRPALADDGERRREASDRRGSHSQAWPSSETAP